MAIVIRPFTEEHIAAVREFNARLLAGGASPHLQFPEHPVPRWLPKVEQSEIYNEFFVALEQGTVRGAYAVKKHPIILGGGELGAGERGGSQVCSAGYYHHPFSEALVNKAYTTVGIHMIREAVRTQPLLYALGMGGYDQPLPKMLRVLKWSDCLVPFFFRVCHPARFLRNLEMLRGSRARRLALDAAAFTGGGWVAIRAAQAWSSLRAPRTPRVTVEEVPDFGEWADALWERSKSRYALAGVRDSRSLRVLFPAENAKFVRLKVSREGVPLGWAVISDARRNPKYGEMRVGSILDCFAAPEDAGAVVRAATQALEARGVDLIVSNQSHKQWCAALREAGFFEGPSNFIFAASPKLSELLPRLESATLEIHMNRSDGDGLYQYV